MKTAGPIVITGFMGCGKTEVARALANRLDLALADLDQKVFEREGRTAAQLIIDEGEPAFRAIETETLRELLLNSAAGVIALGGGAWITDTNRELISQHGALSVWLDAPFEVCWKRIKASTEDRPLGRTRKQAEQLYRLRRPVYQLATFHLAIQAHEHLDSVVDSLEAKLVDHQRL